jgi:hypothetical protein
MEEGFSGDTSGTFPRISGWSTRSKLKREPERAGGIMITIKSDDRTTPVVTSVVTRNAGLDLQVWRSEDRARLFRSSEVCSQYKRSLFPIQTKYRP